METNRWMARARVGARWAIGVATLASLGCQREEAGAGGSGGTSVMGEYGLVTFTPPDVAEPRETWRDNASGISFTSPGTGWRRLAEGEAGVLGDAVKLAVQGPRGCRGWASMKRGFEGGPRTVADAARAEIVLDGLEVHVDEDVKYDMWTARRWEVQGRREGKMTSIRTTFFVDLKRLYRVEAEASGMDYGDRRRCLDQVTAGFGIGVPADGP